MKSGNNPAFKMMAGDMDSPSPITSPANMNNFGIGKGTSPYKGMGGMVMAGIGGGLDAVYGSNISSSIDDKELDDPEKDTEEELDKSDGEKFGETVLDEETPEEKKAKEEKETSKIIIE